MKINGVEVIDKEYTELFLEMYPDEESYYYGCNNPMRIIPVEFDPPKSWNLFMQPKVTYQEKLQKLLEISNDKDFIAWVPIGHARDFLKLAKTNLRKKKLDKLNEISKTESGETL